MCLKNLVFVTVFVFIFQGVSAQRNYTDYNLLGVQGGVALFDINTSDLVTEQQTGFAAGFTTRGAFYEKFDLVYGITFVSANIGVSGAELGVGPKEIIKYNIPSAQLNLLGSFNIISQRLSVEFGPLLNINGKMKLNNERFANYILDGYSTLRAQDIEEISTINFRVMGGLTAGLEKFRVSAHYQYGVTNMLGKLNDNSLENQDFDGHSSTIVITGIIYF